jgi:hypothetical protein
MMIESKFARDTIWPATLAFATVIGSFALACVFPFAAIAALAALTLDWRKGAALVAGVWLANQIVGFFILAFPWDGQAVGHGVAILAATLLGYGAARVIASRIDGNPFARAAAALVAAFVVYEVILLAYAQVGGGADNFTLAIVAEIARNDAFWFAGLMTVRYMLSRATGEAAMLVLKRST